MTNYILAGLLLAVVVGFLIVLDRVTLKYARLQKEKKELIAQYEPFKQAAELAKTAPAQIQDVSDDGKKLLQTIVELLKEQNGTLRELKNESAAMAAIQIDADKMLRAIVKQTGAAVKVPESQADKPATMPAESVTKPKKSHKRKAAKDGSK